VLKQRLITAILLVLAFIGALFFLPSPVFSVLIALVVVLGAWEWSNLSGIVPVVARVAYVALVVAVLGGGYWLSGGVADLDVLKTLLIIACGWWAFSLLLIQGFPTSAVLWGASYIRALMGIFVLVPACLSIIYLRYLPSGAWMVLMLVLVVAAADVGAYFSGRAFGKRKLAPHVSPGKSWEGVVGGALLALGLGCGFSFMLAGAVVSPLFYIVIPVALVSVVGDLLESMVKRHRGVKDSGNLLPGHGGVLDRVDGLVAAAPVFALGLIASNWQG